jgi:hypothetical protein
MDIHSATRTQSLQLLDLKPISLGAIRTYDGPGLLTLFAYFSGRDGHRRAVWRGLTRLGGWGRFLLSVQTAGSAEHGHIKS